MSMQMTRSVWQRRAPISVVKNGFTASSVRLLRIPAMAITNSELMAITIPKDADRRRSEATLGCSYHAEVSTRPRRSRTLVWLPSARATARSRNSSAAFRKSAV